MALRGRRNPTDRTDQADRSELWNIDGLGRPSYRLGRPSYRLGGPSYPFAGKSPSPLFVLGLQGATAGDLPGSRDTAPSERFALAQRSATVSG
jgi:hypothetical protein